MCHFGLWIVLSPVLVLLPDWIFLAHASSKPREHRHFSGFDGTGPVIGIRDLSLSVIAYLKKIPM